MTDLKPFENDSQSTTVGPDNGLTFENGTEQINVYGDLTIDKNSNPADIDSLIDVLQIIKKHLAQAATPETKTKNLK